MQPSNSKPRKLSPQTIYARIVAVIFLIALFFAVFVLPWLFVGGR